MPGGFDTVVVGIRCVYLVDRTERESGMLRQRCRTSVTLVGPPDGSPAASLARSDTRGGGGSRSRRDAWRNSFGPSGLRIGTALSVSFLLAAALVVASAGGAAATAPTGVNARAAAPAGTPFIYVNNATFTDGSYNPYSPNYYGELSYIDLLPLAIQEPPTLTRYLPQLATSWHYAHGDLRIDLRRDAKWQNGEPVTSTDALNALLLQGVAGTGTVFHEVSKISTPTSHELLLKLRAGVPVALLEQSVLRSFPVPTSVYGKFISPGVETALLHYYGGGANGSPPSVVSSASKKLLAFNPTKFVGDGPFELKSLNSQAMLSTKWPGFWAAKKIKIPAFEFEGAGSGSAIEPVMLSGRAVFTNAASMASILPQWRAKPNAHYIAPPGYSLGVILMNSMHAPLNMTPVRQALAYVINRKSVSDAGYPNETGIPENPTRVSDGIYPTLAPHLLTSAVGKALNPYPNNLKKAANILTGLNFKKGPKGWELPNGKPFTLSITAPSQDFPVVPQMELVANELSAFGIKTTTDAIEATAYTAAVEKGQFALAWEGDNATSLDPLQELASILVSFNIGANGHGIGFGPTATVPGLGKVNVVNTLATEAATVGPGKKMTKLVADWARLVNQQVPYESYYARLYPLSYSTAHYGHWPASSSPLWKLTALNQSEGLLVMMERGFLRPEN